MARIRSLKIGFFTNEVLCELSPWHRLLFAGLWILSDREGRLEDRPRRIKATLFPYDEINVDKLLTDLADSGFVVRYAVDAVAYLAIPQFSTHQRPKTDEYASVIPTPTCSIPRGIARRPQLDIETDRDLDRDTEVSPAASAEPLSAVLLEFPTVGMNGTQWPLTERQVAAWQSAFPSLDILAEARKALAWVQANPGRRKTTKGMAKFLVGWLGRTTDHGRQTSAGVVSAPLEPWCRHIPPCRGEQGHRKKLSVERGESA